MPDIFLSYSRDDSVFMRTLLDNLRKLGFNVWIDEEHLTVGTPEWEDAIKEAVERVDAMVVGMTPDSLASKWVRVEVTLAELYGTRIFPVLAAGDELTAVPPRLVNMQYADMCGRSDYEAGFRQLVNGLAAHLGLTVGAFSIDFSGEPRVQVSVYEQNEGTIVAVGGDVAGDVSVAGRDIVHAGEEMAPPKLAATGMKARPTHDSIHNVLPPPFEWLPIPEGSVTLEDDLDVHEVGRFMLARYLITNAQFQVFIDAPDGYRSSGWWNFSSDAESWRTRHPEPLRPERRDGWPDHPRVNLTWFEAVAFCRWLTNRVGYEVRLPAEAEWQRAAQGDDERAYPWGNREPNNRLVNWHGYTSTTTPVGAYPDGASPYGAMDMAGNVWEWCATDYYNPSDSDVRRTNKYRVVRGGSWDSDAIFLTADNRGREDPDLADLQTGFRCARSY